MTESEINKIQQNFDNMMSNKNHELTSLIHINTDLKGQIENMKFQLTKISSEALINHHRFHSFI